LIFYACQVLNVYNKKAKDQYQKPGHEIQEHPILLDLVYIAQLGRPLVDEGGHLADLKVVEYPVV